MIVWSMDDNPATAASGELDGSCEAAMAAASDLVALAPPAKETAEPPEHRGAHRVCSFGDWGCSWLGCRVLLRHLFAIAIDACCRRLALSHIGAIPRRLLAHLPHLFVHLSILPAYE